MASDLKRYLRRDQFNYLFSGAWVNSFHIVTFFYSFAKIIHNFLLYLCKYLQGPAEDDFLIISPFNANAYIYNIMDLQSITNRKQFFGDHPMIRGPKTSSKLKRKHLTQKHDSNKATVMHLY